MSLTWEKREGIWNTWLHIQVYGKRRRKGYESNVIKVWFFIFSYLIQYFLFPSKIRRNKINNRTFLSCGFSENSHWSSNVVDFIGWWVELLGYFLIAAYEFFINSSYCILRVFWWLSCRFQIFRFNFSQLISDWVILSMLCSSIIF